MVQQLRPRGLTYLDQLLAALGQHVQADPRAQGLGTLGGGVANLASGTGRAAQYLAEPVPVGAPPFIPGAQLGVTDPGSPSLGGPGGGLPGGLAPGGEYGTSLDTLRNLGGGPPGGGLPPVGAPPPGGGLPPAGLPSAGGGGAFSGLGPGGGPLGPGGPMGAGLPPAPGGEGAPGGGLPPGGPPGAPTSGGFSGADLSPDIADAIYADPSSALRNAYLDAGMSPSNNPYVRMAMARLQPVVAALADFQGIINAGNVTGAAGDELKTVLPGLISGLVSGKLNGKQILDQILGMADDDEIKTFLAEMGAPRLLELQGNLSGTSQRRQQARARYQGNKIADIAARQQAAAGRGEDVDEREWLKIVRGR